jgi:hypothetical protein
MSGEEKIVGVENLFPPLSSGEPASDVNPGAGSPTFQRESYTPTLIEEIAPLLYAHWKEIATYRDIELKPQWDTYMAHEQQGYLRIYTVRHLGRLVGYSVYVVAKNLHYADSLQANNDIVYLAPELRGKFLGMRFLKWCDASLKADGVQSVILHIKKAHDWGSMAERLGYFAEETIYRRRLDL